MQNIYRYLVLIIALIATIALFSVNIFYGAMAVVLLIVLVMSFRIMGETEHLPDVVAKLQEDAKGIILENRGNGRAIDIHVALVPLNKEFDVPALMPDSTHTLSFPTMFEQVKVVLTFKNTEGKTFSRSYLLSPTGPSEDDLLKPMIPLFGWK